MSRVDGKPGRRSPYKPQLGELVRDLAHKGAVGAYMGTECGLAYLRRPAGGCEWSTPAGEIEPADGVELSADL